MINKTTPTRTAYTEIKPKVVSRNFPRPNIDSTLGETQNLKHVLSVIENEFSTLKEFFLLINIDSIVY